MTTLSSWPTVTWELNTTRDPNDPAGTDTWVDFTPYVLDFTVTRGRVDELSDVQAGTMQLKLRNSDGRFDPANASGPYYPNLKGWRQCRMKASWGDNLLPAATAIPTAAGWGVWAVANASIATQTGYAGDGTIVAGTSAIKVTTTAAGTGNDVAVSPTSPEPCVAGQTMTSLAYFRSNGTTRTVRVDLAFYDSAGTYLGVGTASGTPVVESATVPTLATVTSVAPSGTVQVRVIAYTLNTSNAESHFLSAVCLRVGTATYWTPTGGANLLTTDESAFTSSVAGWTIFNATNAQIFGGLDSGNGAMQWTVNVASTQFIEGDLNRFTPVLPGQTYSMFAFGIARTRLKALETKINWYDSSQTFISSTFGPANIPTALNVWTPNVFSGTAPANAAYAKPILIIDYATASSVNGDIWQWDNVGLYAGNLPYWSRPLNTYNVFQGYEETFWPQQYDSRGRYTYCTPTFVDAFAALAKISLLDCVLDEMLLDAPLALYPLDDSGGSAAGNISATRQATALIQNTGTGIESNIVSPPGFIWDATATAALGATRIPPTTAGTALGFTLATGASFRENRWGSYLKLPSGAFPTSLGSGFSVEFWFRTDALTVSGTASITLFTATTRVPNAEAGGLGTNYLAVSVGGSLYGIQALMGTASGAAVAASASTARYDDGNYHHAVVTVDSTGKNVALEVDGAAITTTVLAATTGLDPSGMSAWAFGQIEHSSATNTNTYNTAVSHIATYATVLSGTRIAAHYTAGLNAFSGESPSTRITRLLTYASWLTALKSIDTTSASEANTPLQGATDLDGKSLLGALLDVADSVMGSLDVDGQGRVRYRARDYRELQTTPAQIWGESSGTGEQPYSEPLPVIGVKPDYLFSQVEVDQLNGISIMRGDAAAELAYFPTAKQISTELLDPNQVIDLADELLRRYKDPHARVERVSFNPAANPSLWPSMLALDLGLRTRFMRRPQVAPTKQLECYVEQVTHTCTASPLTWTVDVVTSAAPPFFPWIIGDATYGVLDSTTIPSF